MGTEPSEAAKAFVAEAFKNQFLSCGTPDCPDCVRGGDGLARMFDTHIALATERLTEDARTVIITARQTMDQMQATIERLRKLLGPCECWVHTTEPHSIWACSASGCVPCGAERPCPVHDRDAEGEGGR